MAFGSNDQFLDSVTLTDVFDVPGLTAPLTAANIAYITFQVDNVTAGLFFDDLSCTPVPVPVALWLRGSGLFALIGTRVLLRRSMSVRGVQNVIPTAATVVTEAMIKSPSQSSCTLSSISGAAMIEFVMAANSE